MAKRIPPGEGKALVSKRRILGIDPGLANVGWGVIDAQGPSVALLDSGRIKTSPRDSHAERLLRIFRTLEEVIRTYRPGVMAVEEVFQGKNPQNAFQAGEGRGACILAGATHELRVVPYAATVVKVALTGNGRASKVQVQAMVCRLLGLSCAPGSYDVTDAIAVAMTHHQRGRSVAGLRSR